MSAEVTIYQDSEGRVKRVSDSHSGRWLDFHIKTFDDDTPSGERDETLSEAQGLTDPLFFSSLLGSASGGGGGAKRHEGRRRLPYTPSARDLKCSWCQTSFDSIASLKGCGNVGCDKVYCENPLCHQADWLAGHHHRCLGLSK